MKSFLKKIIFPLILFLGIFIIVMIFGIIHSKKSQLDKFCLSNGFVIKNIVILGNYFISSSQISVQLSDIIVEFEPKSIESNLQNEVYEKDLIKEIEKFLKKTQKPKLFKKEESIDDGDDKINFSNKRFFDESKSVSNIKKSRGISKYIEKIDKIYNSNESSSEDIDKNQTKSTNINISSNSKIDITDKDYERFFILKNGLMKEKNLKKKEYNSSEYHSILLFDLLKIANSISKLDFIKSIYIKKILPDSLLIHVEEYDPIGVIVIFNNISDMENFIKSFSKKKDLDVFENSIKILTKCGNILNTDTSKMDKLLLFQMPLILVLEKDLNEIKIKVHELDLIVSLFYSIDIKNKSKFVIQFLQSYRWNMVIYSKNYTNSVVVKFPRYNLENTIENFKRYFNQVEQSGEFSIIDMRFDDQLIIVN